jgi:hypothetical protein
VIVPVFNIGVVNIYENQKPEKFEMQTNGNNTKMTLIDSFFKLRIPAETNENMSSGNTKTIISFRNKLDEYNCAFTEISRYLPKSNVNTNNIKTKNGNLKNFSTCIVDYSNWTIRFTYVHSNECCSKIKVFTLTTPRNVEFFAVA